jgi:hypothetical protein
MRAHHHHHHHHHRTGGDDGMVRDSDVRVCSKGAASWGRWPLSPCYCYCCCCCYGCCCCCCC